MAELHHECGICGLYLLPGDEPVRLPAGVVHDDVAPLIPRMLLDLQNRGQLAAGMTGYDPKRDNLLATYRDLGPVDQAFRTANPEKNAKILKSVAGRAAIGHVRYATCGPDNRQYAQPFERPHGVKWKWFAFSFNGQLANYPLLRDELESHGFHLVRATDTEVIMHHLSYELRGGDRVPIEEVFRSLAGRFDGAYNLLYLDAAGEMVALRDPLGIRPLCWGRIGRLVGFASESAPSSPAIFA